MNKYFLVTSLGQKNDFELIKRGLILSPQGGTELSLPLMKI